MTSDSELAAKLADEIRSAVAETAARAPALPEPFQPRRDEAARSALERAQAHVTPSIPEAAPLARAKRIALRLLRFLWRDQAAFNALILEAAEALERETSRQREGAERLCEEVGRQLAAFREERDLWIAAADRKIALAERRVAIECAEVAARQPSAPPATEAGGSGPTGRFSESPRVAAIPAGVYSLFEERFRGTPEEIAQKQQSSLDLLEGVPGPVLDVGCGRGEFLRLLRERGIVASGVEINPIAVAECRESGLEVEQADALAALIHQTSASLGAVVAFQVVEHWNPETTFLFLREARRALAPGGILIAETINVDSLSTWTAFFLDPSHVRPVPAQALRFLAEAAGFAETRIEFRAPLPDSERLTEESPNDAKLNRLLFGPQDYALIARVER